MKFFSSIKEKMGYVPDEDLSDVEEEYVELDSEPQASEDSKVIVRPFNLEDFEDVKPILDSLREGSTIALVNIKTLKDKDMIELKRAVSKIKKTADAVKGDVAGFGEDYIIVVPNFAEIYRESSEQKKETGEIQ
ncbi:MAG: cell division protein SepF [Nanobdellota archaeon]